MGETLQKMREKIQEFWEKTDKKQKIILGVGSLAFIIIVTLLIMKVTSTKYEVLYGDLSLKDMSEITSKLDEMSVDWKTGEENNSILVPAEDKKKAQIELASYGLPKEGYDLSDLISDLGWSMTDSDKKIVEKEFVESSLETTLMEMDGIKEVRVHVGDDTRTSFVLDNIDHDMTASVFVVKDPSKELNNEKVRAIKHLVAGRLNMEAEDVVVADNEGNLLDGESNQGSFDTNQFAVKEELENKIDKSVTKLLTDLYGIGNVSVKSSVRINMDEESSKTVEYSSPFEDGETGIPRSTEEETETMRGGTPGGVPGTGTNVEDYEMLDEYSDEFNRSKRIVNNEINEMKREIKKTPGQVDGITVAVILNRKSLPDGELTEDKKEEISNLVFAATGEDTKQVEVFAEDFTKEEIFDEVEAKTGLNLGLLIPIIIAIIIMVLGLFFFLKRKREEELELEQALLDKAIEEQMGDEDFVDGIDFESKDSNMKKQIDKFIDEKPEAATRLLRNWLNE